MNLTIICIGGISLSLVLFTAIMVSLNKWLKEWKDID